MGDVDKRDHALPESDMHVLAYLKQENRELKERLIFSPDLLRTMLPSILFNSFLGLQITETGRRDSREVHEWFSV